MADVVYLQLNDPLPKGSFVEITPVLDGYVVNGSVAYEEPTPHLAVFTPDIFTDLLLKPAVRAAHSVPPPNYVRRQEQEGA